MQKNRRDNQRQQDGNENLAALPPINQEDRNKEVDSDGRFVKGKNPVHPRQSILQLQTVLFHKSIFSKSRIQKASQWRFKRMLNLQRAVL